METKVSKYGVSTIQNRAPRDVNGFVVTTFLLLPLMVLVVPVLIYFTLMSYVKLGNLYGLQRRQQLVQGRMLKLGSPRTLGQQTALCLMIYDPELLVTTHLDWAGGSGRLNPIAKLLTLVLGRQQILHLVTRFRLSRLRIRLHVTTRTT